MLFLFIIIAVCIPHPAIIPSDLSRRYKNQSTNTSFYDSLIFGENGPFFSSEQVKATSDTRICEVDTREYKNLLRTVKSRIQTRLNELPKVSRTHLNLFEKHYEHQLDNMYALSDSLFDTSDLSKEDKNEKNKSLYDFDGQMRTFPQKIIQRINTHKETEANNQQIWYDQINIYNTRTALKARIKKIDKALSEQDKAAWLSLGGTKCNEDASVHKLCNGDAVKLPPEIVKLIGEHIVTQPESEITHVSERDIIKNAQWISYFKKETNDKNEYNIKSIMIDINNTKQAVSCVSLKNDSKLGFILRNHIDYKNRAESGSARL